MVAYRRLVPPSTLMQATFFAPELSATSSTVVIWIMACPPPWRAPRPRPSPGSRPRASASPWTSAASRRCAPCRPASPPAARRAPCTSSSRSGTCRTGRAWRGAPPGPPPSSSSCWRGRCRSGSWGGRARPAACSRSCAFLRFRRLLRLRLLRLLLLRALPLRLAAARLLREQRQDPRQVALVLGHVGGGLQRARPAADLEIEEVLAELGRLAGQLLDAQLVELGCLHRQTPSSLERLTIRVCSGSL